MAGDHDDYFQMWNPDAEAALISLLTEHTEAGRLLDGKGRKNVWVEIAGVLTERFHHEYTQRDVQGKVCQLRCNFVEFRALINASGFVWDETNNTVHAPETTWREYCSVYRRRLFYREKGFSAYAALRRVFI